MTLVCKDKEGNILEEKKNKFWKDGNNISKNY